MTDYTRPELGEALYRFERAAHRMGEAFARAERTRRMLMSFDEVPDQMLDEWRLESTRQAALRRERLYRRQVRRAELRKAVRRHATFAGELALLLVLCFAAVVTLWLLAG